MKKKDTHISQVKVRQDPVNQLAIEMRAKRFGLTIEEAKNPLAGSYVGRLYLQGKINQDQYDAAQKYLEVKNNYLCAKGLPNAIYDNFTPSSNEEAQNGGLKEQLIVMKRRKRLSKKHNTSIDSIIFMLHYNILL